MSAAALISIEEYLRRTDKPYCEYDHGVLVPKPMPTTLHAFIQAVLVRLLAERGVIALTEITLPVAPGKFLVPDVAVVNQLEFPYPTQPPLLCVEILSPDDRTGATLAKCESYHSWGVPYCWVIDPQKRTAWEYYSSSEPERVNDHLRSGQLTVAIPQLFADLPPASNA